MLHSNAFELKKGNATYRHAMSIIFKEHLHKTIEFYVDDLTIKSKKNEDHFQDLWTMFGIMRKN